jgi:hypothetical protein
MYKETINSCEASIKLAVSVQDAKLNDETSAKFEDWFRANELEFIEWTTSATSNEAGIFNETAGIDRVFEALVDCRNIRKHIFGQ